jgi:mono/diheme cytochrome c family protein
MKQSILRKRLSNLWSKFNFHRLFFSVFLLGFILIVTKIFGQQPPWVAPKAAADFKNPLSGDNSKLAETKALYITNCGPCHGEKGKGDGPAAPGLNPKPADHTSAVVQSETDGAIFWKLSEGRTPMPGYKKIFSDQQRWEMVNYIRTLAKTKKK